MEPEFLTEEHIAAMELCAEGFSRCGNYPRDDGGIRALAKGLLSASRRTGVPMEKIVSEAKELSRFCPTDFDLMSVAHDIKGPELMEDIPIPKADNVRQEWRAFEGQHAAIMRNATAYHEDLRDVCGKIRAAMGSEKWNSSSTAEKVRAGIALGLPVFRKPTGNDCERGLGQFVDKRDLPPISASSTVVDASKKAAGYREW